MCAERGDYERISRARQMLWVAAALFAALFVRLAVLQTIEAGRYHELSETNRAKLVRARAPRGQLYDRAGRPVGGNRPCFSLVMSAAEASRHPATTSRVSAWAGMPDSVVQAALADPRAPRFEPVCLLRDLPFELVSRFEERNFEVPGTAIEVDPVRSYPWGTAGAHLVGYLGEVSEEELAIPHRFPYRRGDYRGRAGVERLCEEFLRGRDGGRFVEVNAQGKEVRELPEHEAIPPREGHRVILAVDMELEAVAQRALEDVGAGAVVALDPRNGDLLAMVSSPGFDPNDFSGGIAAEEWNALNRDPAHPLLNRAVTGVYPPGSTFKVAVATMALDAGVVRPEETLRPCTGGYAMGNRVFRCWRAGGHGALPMREAIAQSCDVYFYQLGQRIGLENMARYVRRWGITDKPGSGLSGEVRGLFPDSLWLDRQYGHSGWTRAVELNLAIGQGEVLVTPLGLATFVGGVANGGEIMTPRVWLRAVTPAGRLVKDNAPHGRSMGVSREALAVVREGMAGAVAHGTARAAQLAGITVAGKTGTAQNPHGGDHAWFVGFAPAENPEIVVLALVEGGGHGGAVAAPIVARVMRAYFGLEAGGGI